MSFFAFGCEDGKRDVIILIPDHCLFTFQMEITQPVWDTVNFNRMDVTRAIVKMCTLTGTNPMQTQRNNFRSERAIYVMYPLCFLEAGDIINMLSRCPVLSAVCSSYLNEFT